MKAMRSGLLAGVAILAGLALSGAVRAHEYKLGDITIQHPWARASIGAAKAGAAYLTVTNAGEAVDRLAGVSSPRAGRVDFHGSLIEDGVAKMRRVEAIEVAPGEPAVLRPGGLHVMLMGLTAPLIEGELLPLTLTFERAGTVEIEAYIDEATAGQGSDHGAHRRPGDS